MKIEKKVFIQWVVVVVLIISFCIACFYIEKKRNLQFALLDKKIETLETKLLFSVQETQRLIEQKCEETQNSQNEIKSELQILKECFFNTDSKLKEIQSSSKNQFIETKKMKSTYDELLEEQKKLTIDVAGKDTEISQMKKDADEYFQKGDFTDAYQLYCNVLLYQNDNLEVRRQKMFSLYYINPMDSANYGEVLEDCRILKTNGKDTAETNKIEQLIMLEVNGIQGIENEE